MSILPSLSMSHDSFGLDSTPMCWNGDRNGPKVPVPSARFSVTRRSALSSFTVVRSTKPSPLRSPAMAPYKWVFTEGLLRFISVWIGVNERGATAVWMRNW